MIDLDESGCLLSVRSTDIFEMVAECVWVIVYGIANSHIIRNVILGCYTGIVIQELVRQRAGSV